MTDTVDGEAFSLDELLSFRLIRLTNSMNKIAAASTGEDFDLALSEWQVLACIGEAGHSSVMDIARRTRIDKGWISRASQALLGRGLIARRADPRDSRRAWLTLTEEGERLFARAVVISRARNATYAETLSPGERLLLNELLDKVQRRVDRLAEGEATP
ncbi:MarR family winged helix-turn-helix transcriptional regulator [Halomonas sp. NCCP-2165]|nr:MarR family winged helix-turn-helix transcriptional regulator [Halomonas sp. NCCP-2165]GKW50914.1 hypothetical protein NCCP2165_31290 [Halomonas sp. NCCP-2165]